VLNIVWDIDSVLNNFEEEWFLYYKSINHEKYKNLFFNDIVDNPPHNILGITKEEYLESLNYFRKYCMHTVKPNMSVLDWLNVYGSKINSSVLTSALYPSLEESAYWLFSNYKRYIRSYTVIPSYINKENAIIYDETKLDFLKKTRNVDIFIDDNEKTINSVKEFLPHIKVFCPKQPWNNGVKIETILNDLTRIIHDKSF
jgi:hypothetical protein